MPQQSPIYLDEFDRQILRQVQADASISTQGLAERVGLSASPCWRRLKRMQEAGLITGQVAMVSPRALGLRAVAYLNHVGQFVGGALAGHGDAVHALAKGHHDHRDGREQRGNATGTSK